MPTLPYEKTDSPLSFSPPIPTKFIRGSDTPIIFEAVKSTGLSRSEVIRRAVRLLGQHRRQTDSYAFLVDLTPTR